MFSTISRHLLYTITRENGDIGDILINVTTIYNPVSENLLCTAICTAIRSCIYVYTCTYILQDPTLEYVEEFSTIMVSGQREQQVALPIASDAYLAPGSNFTIAISEAVLQDLEGLYIVLCLCLA